MNIERRDKKVFWAFPWTYKESFVVVFTILFLGFALEYFSNSILSPLAFPNNLIVLGIYLFVLITSFLLFKNSKIIHWLRSPQLAIASISSILILVILMGSFTQDLSSSLNWVNRFGLNRIAFSFPFLLSLFFFLTNLALVIIYRLKELNIRSLLFAVNHIGIFVVTISMMFSVGDIQKHTVKINKDNYLFELNNNGITEELPFALRLIDFELELFPPKIAIIENATDEIISGNGFLLSADTDSIIDYKGFNISVNRYLPKAVKQVDTYYFVNDVGFSPAAFLNIVYPNGDKIQKWVSCGSFVYPSEFASLDSNFTVAMLEPEAKSFLSKIQVSYPNQKQEEIVLRVNQPVSIKGWDIYQTDYDKEMGTWSDYSIVEMVYDPWLPVIYAGIFMLIIGAVLLMFAGQNSIGNE